MIKDELLEKPSIKSLVKTCRHICTFSNTSVLFAQCIVKLQLDAGTEKHSCLHLMQDVATRWNSTFLMLKRFLALQPHVRSLLADQDWQKKVDVKISNSEWVLMEKVVKVLKVFYEATVQFSAVSACISEVKKKLKESVTERLGGKEMLEQYSLATLLDPRYKNCFFSKRVAKDQAEAALLRVLKAEVSLEPDSHENSGNELMQAEPAEGQAGVC